MTHRYEMRDGIPQIVIYIYTPLDYEFATDLNTIKYNAINTVSKIREYVQNNFSHNTNSTVMLIVNGVVLGSLAVTRILDKI
jgi:hypothetical protein